MKHFTLIVIFLLLNIALSHAQEYRISFKVDKKTELDKLSEQMSIDKVSGNLVQAYLNAHELEKFKQSKYEFEFLPHPGAAKDLTMATTVAEMANWDRYPTHDVYLEMIQNFADNYPNICRIETIGMSEEGRAVKVLKITDNPDTEEAEPEFFYTGQMHGDEIVGYILLLRLADYLLSNYGTDTRVTEMIDNIEIWINPLSNPDGTYAAGDNSVSGATRGNSNYVDLNRNFPTPLLENPSGGNEAEVQMMTNFAQANHFVMSANLHGGIELVNYPWDTWYSSENKHADHNWFEAVSYRYADTVHLYADGTSYFTGQGDGVTHGADWYKVNGSRQDYMCWHAQCREVTLELSNPKMPNASSLPTYWDYNKNALLAYIEECRYGFYGTVKNENGEPLDAKIEIYSHDKDSSMVFTDPQMGDYYRPIETGTYTVNYSAFGYIPQNHELTINSWNLPVLKNVVLLQAQQTNVSGLVSDFNTGLPVEDALVELTGAGLSPVQTNASGEYHIDNVVEGTYNLRITAQGYSVYNNEIAVSETQNEFNAQLYPADAESFELEVPPDYFFTGDADWFRSNDEAYEGAWSMKSGLIDHNQETVMQVSDSFQSGEIAFYAKVSSESSYDFLRFFINDELKLELSGEADWAQYNYPVSEGAQVFVWKYIKDTNTSNGSDCAWVDYVSLPPFSAGLSQAAEKDDMRIYPMPTTGDFRINCTQKIMKLELYNYAGQKIRELEAGRRHIYFKREKELSGIFILKAKTESGLVLTKKIILL